MSGIRRPKRAREVLLVVLVACTTAAGCGSSVVEDEPPGAAPGPITPGLLDADAPAEVTEWLKYDRAAEFESISAPVRVPTRDGTELSCILYRPGKDGTPDTGVHPGLVADFTPYVLGYNAPHHIYLAEHGYNVITCSVRGSGDSGGEFPTWFQEKETQDNYDLIEWFADQPFSTGDIGQFGSSYGSITSYRVAALQPPHLRAILPIVSPTDIYAEWVYPGGVPTTNDRWSFNGPVLDERAHASTLKLFQDNPLRNEFWEQIVTTNKLKDVTVPALHIGGYFDIFKDGGFDALAQRPEQTWLLNGPWAHLGQMTVPGKESTVPGVDTANSISTGTILQWFDHWIGDMDSAALPVSRVISYESNSTPGSGEWTVLDEWPARDVSYTRLFPLADGSVSEQEPPVSQSLYAVNPTDGPSGISTGSLPTDPAVDQSVSERSDRLANGRFSSGRATFTLPAFDEDTTVAGPVALHLNASISANDTYFVSKLETVLPDGRVLPIETGELRAQMRTSLATPENITPGVPLDYVVELGDTHWKFESGEQLRVTLSGGDFPRVAPNAPAGTVTINHGPGTYLSVPMLPS